jgi:hypothetical protein
MCDFEEADWAEYVLHTGATRARSAARLPSPARRETLPVGRAELTESAEA